MLKGHKTAIKLNYLIMVMVFLMTIFTISAHAQYNGECWAADYTNVYKISADGKAIKIAGFSQSLSVAINPSDGSCWVADTDAVSLRKLSADGKELARLNGTSEPPVFTTNPSSVSVDPRDGSCWVAVIDSVYKFSSDAKQLLVRQGYNEPVLTVNPNNGECWIADSNNARIVRLSPDGKQLGAYQIDGITQPKSISINPADNSCWILDPFTQNVARLSTDGNIMMQASVAPASGAIMATAVSASLDGGCWVALMIDTMNDVVLKLSPDGKQALSVGGFSMPYNLAYDFKDGGCWVADANNGRIIKLSSSGQQVMGIDGLDQPKVVTVAYQPK